MVEAENKNLTVAHASESQTFNLGSRATQEPILRTLLGTDYDHTINSGLIDMFHYDSESNTDGLIHTLIGDETGGFHSEAAQTLLRNNPETAYLVSGTEVDRDHLLQKNSKERRPFFEIPYEPSTAKISIDGLAKTAVRKKGEGSVIIDAANSMYPKEYDVVTTLHAIRQAMESRDPNSDDFIASPHGDVIVNNTGEATMLDGVTKMPIRLVLDPNSKKIITAIPQPKSAGRMKLQPEAIQEHLGLTH